MAHVPLRPLGTLEDTFFLATPALAREGGVYLSAGVHGDEPAGTEALVTWAEQNAARLATLPLLLFPCLNPHGLAANSRHDAGGHDINRSFHNGRHAVARSVSRLVESTRFSAALHLHEDYDAEGAYVYELTRKDEGWGRKLLAAADPLIPRDHRPRIDGRHAADGLIRRRVTAATFEKIGLPEAVWLWFGHTDRSFTFETPSEFALGQRVAAQVAVIAETVRLATRL